MADQGDQDERLSDKLDELKELIQTLVIIEGVKSGFRNSDIRKLLRIDMNRITLISKLYEKAKRGNRGGEDLS